jgi:signal transduction histidine kinase
MIEVSVSDEGAGIEDKDRARAIERFVRLDESRNGDGSGLGLSLMAAICHHHGGTLELQDNAPGLRLVMRLPKTGARVA